MHNEISDLGFQNLLKMTLNFIIDIDWFLIA